MEYFVTEDIDKSIILKAMGSEVDGRVWCVGILKSDKTHRMRDYDGFYVLDNLKKINK